VEHRERAAQYFAKSAEGNASAAIQRGHYRIMTMCGVLKAKRYSFHQWFQQPLSSGARRPASAGKAAVMSSGGHQPRAQPSA